MARPIKNKIDFFPHIAVPGKTLFVLEEKFGNDGYAFWFKLLEMLANSDKHYFRVRNSTDWLFFVAKTKVSEEKAEEILKILCELEAIDKKLWEKRIIWCQKFVDNIADVYEKRNRPVPTREDVLADIVNDTETPVSGEFSDQKSPETPVFSPEMRQSRVDKSRVDKSRVYLKKHYVALFPKSDPSHILTSRLIRLMQQNNPKARAPNEGTANFDKWCQEIERMERIDKYTFSEIEELIDFSQRDAFWSGNVLSTAKLRKQAGALKMQMKRRDKGSVKNQMERMEDW